MSDRKYVVPEGMVNAAIESAMGTAGMSLRSGTESILAGALKWLAENPITPTNEEFIRLSKDLLTPEDAKNGNIVSASVLMAEWQRRMFLEPEPEIPDEVDDLIWDMDTPRSSMQDARHNRQIVEAFKRGLKSTKGW